MSWIITEYSGSTIRTDIKSITKDWMDIASIRKQRSQDPFRITTYEALEKVNWVAHGRSCRKANFEKTYQILTSSLDPLLPISAFAFIILHQPEDTLPSAEKTADPHISQKERIQMINQEGFIYLNYLSANPEDFFSATRVKGAGVSLVQHLFKTCEKQQRAGILVEPLPQAKVFFEKLGFKPLFPENAHKRTLIWKRS